MSMTLSNIMRSFLIEFRHRLSCRGEVLTKNQKAHNGKDRAYELSLSDPALVRHLQRQCTLCESRKGCLQELAQGCRGAACRDHGKWREYCPNAAALDMLIVLQKALLWRQQSMSLRRRLLLRRLARLLPSCRNASFVLAVMKTI
jgi:hypothetical protein